VIVSVNERKRGAGHFILGGGADSADDSLRECGLACAQISRQKDQHARFQPRADFPAPRYGFL
jgi:hypothetical protein